MGCTTEGAKGTESVSPRQLRLSRESQTCLFQRTVSACEVVWVNPGDTDRKTFLSLLFHLSTLRHCFSDTRPS